MLIFAKKIITQITFLIKSMVTWVSWVKNHQNMIFNVKIQFHHCIFFLLKILDEKSILYQ